MNYITTTALLCSFLITNTAMAKEEKDSEFDVQVSLGAVYTDIDQVGYSGEGIGIATKFIFDTKEIPIDIYGKISYQSTKDDGKEELMLDETELTLGIQYAFTSSLTMFLEEGYIKQNVDNESHGIWRETETATRLGGIYASTNFSLEVAAEYRDEQDELGFTSHLFLGESLHFSYTNVGDYQSIGLNITSKF